MTLSGVFLTGSAPAWVLLAAGAPAAVAALQAQAAPTLASALALSLVAPLDPQQPDHALAALALLAGAKGSAAALAPLPRDPGHPLDDGRHWAEALGAWRQPTLVLVTDDQLESGVPAAICALLRQWQVPCLGLVHWGGDWSASGHRRDGLPWLGGLAAGGDADGALALRAAARASWSSLQAGLAGQGAGIRAS